MERHLIALRDQKLLEYVQNHTARQAARKFKLSPSHVHAILRNNGVRAKVDDKRKIRDAKLLEYAQDHTPKQIAAEFNVSLSIVYYVLRKNKIKPLKIDEEEIELAERIADMVNEHVLKEIAETLGISLNRLNYLINKHNIPHKKELRKEKDEEIVALAREYEKKMTFREFMKMIDKTVSKARVRALLFNNNIHFLRPSPFKGKKWEEKRKDVDIEHLKAHAHEYTCLEYMRLFNPPCARGTLYNRAAELGVKFKTNQEKGA